MAKSGFVSIVGRPNAGKSTLLNRVLGTEISIVTPKAQTTRERVLGILTEEQGQMVFIDTPGIHRAKEGGLNATMMNEAREALDSPNLVWYLVDPSSGLSHEETVLKLLEKTKPPVLLLLNKADLVRYLPALGPLEAGLVHAIKTRGIPLLGVRRISARKGEGVEELVHESWKLLPEGPLHYPDSEQISDRPVRFFVAEKIREQLLMKLGDELPYSCAVEIESFNESNPTLARIEATIHVERDSQKGMVIGKQGAKIKEIGQAARIGIEKFMGRKIYLGLRVKVLKDWSCNSEALKRMGYHLPTHRSFRQ